MAVERVLIGLAIAIAPSLHDPAHVAWIDAQIAEANRLFAPAGVGFRWVVERDAAARFEHVETREDRDAVADVMGLEPKVVNVTLTESLRDVDDPSRMRMGVCWTHRTTKARYVIFAATSKPTVLAHELGHFFGNPHTTVPNNLMSYVRTDPDAVAFDSAQIARIDAHARTFLTTGALVEQMPPRLWP